MAKISKLRNCFVVWKMRDEEYVIGLLVSLRMKSSPDCLSKDTFRNRDSAKFIINVWNINPFDESRISSIRQYVFSQSTDEYAKNIYQATNKIIFRLCRLISPNSVSVFDRTKTRDVESWRMVILPQKKIGKSSKSYNSSYELL